MVRKTLSITSYQANKELNAIRKNGVDEKSKAKNLESYNRTDGDDNNNKEKLSKGEKNSASVSYISLFRYSTVSERVMVIVGIILASVGAIGIPLSVVIYGELTSLLVDRTTGIGSSTPTLILQLFGGGQILTNETWEVNRLALIKDSEAFGIASLVGGLFEFTVVSIGVYLLNVVAERQIERIRILFLESILRQDMTWYDTSASNSFASKMTEDLEKLKEGIGEKLAIISFLIMTFVISIVAAFIYGWKLTLVMLTCCPVIIISTALVAKVQSSLTEKELKSYAVAGGVAEEVFSGIRTVVAFSGEQKEMERYNDRLKPAVVTGSKKGLYSGLGGGVMWFIIYCCYALALWYGVQLIIEDRDKEYREYTPAVLVIVLFGVIIGAQNLGFSSPYIESFTTARASANSIFAIIDRKSPIDAMDETGLKPTDLNGDITFENIHFRYPARSHIEVLKGFDLTIQSGQTVAFVGPSGCGKSTCLQLLQRLYNPLEGQIKIDGNDISELNVAWLRSQIGVVGQEPVLFATTIGENIRYGKPNATEEEIEKAARMANCHHFIMKQPDGYNTMVGERGAQMSGGQKQRIAIARALVRNPKILLLDEATSALDPTSERRVQDALDLASVGRTTLVVSHRLSTVTNANKIVYIENGVVSEQGTHAELMEKQGRYWDLVNLNKRKETVEEQLTDPNVRKRLLSLKSVKSSEDNISEHGDVKDAQEAKYKVTWKKLIKLNAPEWKYILIGSIAAILHGSTYPAWAVFFGEFFGILGDPDSDYIMSEAILFSYLFIGIGLIAGLGTLLQTYMFNKAGVLLTSRLRQRAFKAIVSQEVGWFDEKKNSVGALCARLAGDCSNVQGATGSRIGVMVQSVSTLFVGVILSLIYCWNLALVTLATVPLVLGAIYFESRFMNASAIEEKIAIENASQVAVEAIANIRTVTSLGQEPFVLQRYKVEITKVREACHKKTRFRGAVFSLGQAAPFFAYGISLYYGGLLVANEGLEYKNVIKVSEALIFGSWMLGQALAYAPNVNAALISTGRLLKLFERVPKIHNPTSQAFDAAEKIDGDIEYDEVLFSYPTRPELPVLQGLDLKIKKGNTVALVGTSGCGKSTCIQLLLRYYDPDFGRILIKDTPTTDFQFDKLRSQLGLVSQEPVLFDRTIAANIAYGNNFTDVPMADVIQASKNANIHSFVMTLPNGYDTSLGNKGAQLSGGQKQRIAIARALVRNPKILILDEATSALDIHSEKIVQDALDAASAGRTCITIAHRLTTIQNADLICVLKAGVVEETGTHDELIALNGIYAQLYSMQQIA